MKFEDDRCPKCGRTGDWCHCGVTAFRESPEGQKMFDELINIMDGGQRRRRKAAIASILYILAVLSSMILVVYCSFSFGPFFDQLITMLRGK